MAQCHRLATTEVVAESAAEQPGSLSGRPVSSREEHVSAMTTHKSWCRHSEARPLPSMACTAVQGRVPSPPMACAAVQGLASSL